MSAILLTAAVLGLAVALVELRAVHGFAPLRRLIRRHPAAGLVTSLGAALLLGGLFGAAGVIALLGGVLAVLITWPVYTVDRTMTRRRLRRRQGRETGAADRARRG